jgi:hypothetical protein
MLPRPRLLLINFQLGILFGLLQIAMNLVVIFDVVLGLDAAVETFVLALSALPPLSSSHPL